MMAIRARTRDDPTARLRTVRESLAYHDMEAATGFPGIGVTWLDGHGLLRVAVVLERQVNGVTGLLGQFSALVPPEAALGVTIEEGPRADDLGDERLAWAIAFPGPLRTDPVGAGLPMPDVLDMERDHVAMARGAVRGARVSPTMRSALHALIDHGAPPVSNHLRMIRRQADDALWDATGFLAAHPALANCINDKDFADSLYHGASFRSAMKARWPGMTEAHLRRLRGVGRTMAGMPACMSDPRGSLNQILTCLFDMPPEWTPRDPEGWCSLHALSVVAWTMRERGGHANRTLLAPSRGHWRAYVDRVARTIMTAHEPLADPQGYLTVFHHAAQDAGDAPHALKGELLVPMLAHVLHRAGTPPVGREATFGISVLARKAAETCLYGGLSLDAALEGAQRWHVLHPRISAGVRSAGVDLSWPALFEGPVDLGGGIAAVAIGDAASLREEGAVGALDDGSEGMAHCIASRLPRFLDGESHALSIRRPLPGGRFERLSTVQVGVSREARHGHAIRLVIEEHRGHRNADPPPLAFEALWRLVGMVGDGRVAPRPEALARRGRDGVDAIMEDCGYDWRDPEALAKAASAWSPALPRWLRGLAPDTMVEVLVARGALPPDWAESRTGDGDGA